MGTVADVLRIAAAEIDTVEQPTNRQKYSTALGRPAESWCADFCEWVLKQAGVAGPARNTYGNAGTLVGSFPKAAAPQPGDLVGYHFPGEAAGIDHVGIVESVNVAAQTITSIEGNTTSGAAGVQSNGGGVYRRVRPMSQAVAFGRPSYVTVTAQAVKGVAPMFSPALQIAAVLDCPTGGMWAVSPDGHVYAFGGAPYLDAPAGKSYWGSRQAAQLVLVDGKYQVVDTAGEKYGPSF